MMKTLDIFSESYYIIKVISERVHYERYSKRHRSNRKCTYQFD